ncbi:MAG: hypothetical protein M0P01_05230 [Treponema sp.]|nr:hypothetical protein [Treponema sp.]
MNPRLAEIIAARKTFFIMPDQTLFPENYLEEYLIHGYETYFIENDKACSIEKKVDIIRRVFQDSILFFNIDASVSGIEWPQFIAYLQKLYGDSILLGVVYAKRQTLEERLALEKYYLYDIGIKCGCVQLEYRKKTNFGIVEKTLYANQGMGRRKYVRALCDNNSGLTFLQNGKQYTGIIYDISLSHFSCTLSPDCPVKEHEKLYNIQLNIKGLHIRADAGLYMKRRSSDGMLYIFTFINKQGENGLDIFVKQLLVPKLYEIMSGNCKNILNRLFYKSAEAKGAAKPV